MLHATLDGCIEHILITDEAKPGDHYTDDWGNDWVVHEDRDGVRLEFKDEPNVWIPYRTAMHIKLPGFQRTSQVPVYD